MKQITKFKSNDGEEWLTKGQAIERDRLDAKVKKAMKPLGDIPEGVSDGKGWLQHNLETVKKAKDDILDICRDEGMDKSFPAFKSKGRDCHPLSIIGRILDDNGGPLNHAWSRFCRIDEKGREHQQPYFAYTSGPDKSHVCIEDRSN